MEHVDETLQSLQFGSRAMCVRIQAVVNERVDYKTLHAEMITALATQDQKSSLLEASLLEKDAQLEAVQARLQVGGGEPAGARAAVWAPVQTVPGLLVESIWGYKRGHAAMCKTLGATWQSSRSSVHQLVAGHGSKGVGCSDAARVTTCFPLHDLPRWMVALTALRAHSCCLLTSCPAARAAGVCSPSGGAAAAAGTARG